MNRKILRLAIPNIISNISIPLLGLIDVALMGHIGNKAAIGAIAIGSMLFNFIFWAFGFLRMGTSGFTAQAFGKRDLKESVAILSRSVVLALASGFILIILQLPVAYIGFKLCGASDEVVQMASTYFYIRIYSAPATIVLFALTGWFIGMQNARMPMYIAIFVNLVNIAYSLFFIKVLGMKVEGIAWGSLLAQYTGLLFAVVLMLTYYKKLFKYFDIAKLRDIRAFKDFLFVNKDIFIRTLLLIITISFFTAESARLGDTILASNTLLYQFFIFFSYFMDGFAYAAESLVGKYIGARDENLLRTTIKRLFLWGIGIALAFTFIYITSGKYLIPLLTNNTLIISYTQDYIYLIYLLPLVTFAAFLWDGIYVGATASVAMRNSMLVSTLVLFFPLYYFAFHQLGNLGLWIAFLIFLFSRGILLQLFSKKYIYSSFR